MYTLKVENERGEMLTLSNNKNYTIVNVEGLNPPLANITSSKITNFDGGKFNSTSLEMRNIIITLTPEYPVETNRLAIYQMFRPKHDVTIYFKNGTRDVFINGRVETCVGNPFSEKQEIQISILCANPYFIDVNQLTLDFSSTIKNFKFPVAFIEGGIPFSSVNRVSERCVTNLGDSECGVNIECEFIGDVVELKIYDASDLDYMLLNYEFHAGDVLHINTNKGNKSITLERDGETLNIINAFDKTSKWLQLGIGENRFTFDCVYGKENVLMMLYANVLYMGV